MVWITGGGAWRRSATYRPTKATMPTNCDVASRRWRRVHTRYDKLAANFLSGVALATAMAFWL